jgi:integrase/recombinase XerD
MQISATETEAQQTNDNIINEYFIAMQTEINSSPNYKKINLNTLTKLSRFHKNKLFRDMTREDIVSYLNSLRKSNEIDPLHRWIGTYNLYVTNLVRFFKWLYNPILEPSCCQLWNFDFYDLAFFIVHLLV